MEIKERLFLEAIAIIFLSSVTISVTHRSYGACKASPPGISKEDKCPGSFQCFSGSCKSKAAYCNGFYDCSDKSDEDYCKATNSRYSHSYSRDSYSSYYCLNTTTRYFTRCSDTDRCIPVEFVCDGQKDCASGTDELDCDDSDPLKILVHFSRRKAIQWLHNKTTPQSSTRKWGPHVHKTAVALFLSDPDFVKKDSNVRKEISYELAIQLLSKLSQKRIENIPSTDLASFINAFLVTCINPRNFHGFNLVQELRKRVENQNITNPYELLTLCNAGDPITMSDAVNIADIFWSKNRELWTDIQAIALMALSCASNQTDSSVDSETVNELALELKSRQYRNGTVESLHTTLLVLQALYAAEPTEDPDNFDEKKALSYIFQSQKPDGSFGNFLLTYYALPVLSCKSLVNISNSHCEKVPKDEDTAIFDLTNYAGQKVRVQYSIWIGMNKDIEKTLTMRVPASSSFYGVMEIAAEIDPTYKFQCVVKNRKPYINSVSGILDDPENGLFWFPYIIKDKQILPLNTSTVDMVPKEDDYIVMWYRSGNWSE